MTVDWIQKEHVEREEGFIYMINPTNIVRKGVGLLFAAIEKQKGRLDCAYEGGESHDIKMCPV